MSSTREQSPHLNPSVNPDEVAKFSALADQWWDEKGKFKPLHVFNPVRISYIRDKAIEHFGDRPLAKPLEGLSLLDIGCGGGLLCEPMRRLGAEVTGIDASQANIKTAAWHADESKLAIEYQAVSAETLAKTGRTFDIVLNMEVIEHVADIASFMQATAVLLKPGGMLVMATLNRTIKSYALAIIGAEYILRWLPKRTHDWHAFVKPAELNDYLEKEGLRIRQMKGVTYRPLTQSWALSDNIDVNYMVYVVK